MFKSCTSTAISIESGSSLVKALQSKVVNSSEISVIVSDCWKYQSAISSVLIQHIYREANECAHRLAHVACYSIINDIWLDETFVIIRDVHYEDFSCCTRGLGSLSPSMFSQSFINNI